MPNTDFVFFGFICFSIMVFMWAVLSSLSILASKIEKKGTRETLSAFECGFDSKHFGRTSFSINFCVFLILFLVFDIELVFFFHLPMVLTETMTTSLYLFLFVASFIFLGFLYEEKSMTWVLSWQCRISNPTMGFPNSFLGVFLLGVLSMFFLEKMWIWVMTELIFAIMLTELMKRSESLPPIILFVMLEVSLSISLIGGFFLESESLLTVFCIGKLGIVPLWFWVFRLFQGLDYRSLFSIMSVYKIIPLGITFLFVNSSIIAGLICLNSLVMLYLFFGVAATSNLLAVLVVFSTGWLLAANASSGFSLGLFFLFYMLMLSSLLFSEKSNPSLIMLLFYSGLPPLGSFFGKLFLLVTSSSSWGMLFIPLFSGLMIVTTWLFVGMSSKSGKGLLISLLFLLGVFVCLRSFVEALAF